MTTEKTSKRTRKKGKGGGKRKRGGAGAVPEKRPLGRPRHPPGVGLGERIDALAMSIFGSRTKLALAAGMVPSRLSETIRGKTKPTTATLEKIASACNLTVSDLLAGEEEAA